MDNKTYKAIKKANLLSEIAPELRTEWDETKNSEQGLCFDEITAGSGKKAWWICEKGHHFIATISKRAQGRNCPYCSNKKVLKGYNDLLTINPEIAAEWDYEKNAQLRPDEVTSGSNKSVWWKCPTCGYSYQNSICNRTGLGNGCPACSNRKLYVGFNDLKTKYPDIASEWNFKRNNKQPQDYLCGTPTKVWWECSKCGFEWEASINARTGANTGCPACSGRALVVGKNDLQTLYPKVAAEWDYDKNNNLTPNNITAHNGKRVWWKCSRGHSWKTTVASRTGKIQTGCPICSSNQQSSLPEQAILYYLSLFCIAENRSKIANQEIDVFLPEYNIGVEYDGWLYHSGEAARKKEEKKNKILADNGITLFRVKESQDVNQTIGNTVYYVINSSYSNLTYAIQELIHLIEKSVNVKIKLDIDFIRDREEISQNYERAILKQSLLTTHPAIAREWDYSKNGKLVPEMFSMGSREEVYWVCKKGHSYKAPVLSRARGDGCPYCSNHRILVGFNDLATTHQELLCEWNYDKNEIKPEELSFGSGKKIWWKCSSCKHEWEAPISSRTKGIGCPECGKEKAWKKRKAELPIEKTLKHNFPDLIEEWSYEKNEVDPGKVSAKSGEKVWWKCSKCDYEWRASISNRTGKNKTGCPKCAGKIIRIRCIETNKEFTSVAEASRWVGVASSSITNCLTGRSKTSAGYHWEYVDKE